MFQLFASRSMKLLYRAMKWRATSPLLQVLTVASAIGTGRLGSQAWKGEVPVSWAVIAGIFTVTFGSTYMLISEVRRSHVKLLEEQIKQANA